MYMKLLPLVRHRSDGFPPEPDEDMNCYRIYEPMAEWLCRGLQSFLREFDSPSVLQLLPSGLAGSLRMTLAPEGL